MPITPVSISASICSQARFSFNRIHFQFSLLYDLFKTYVNLCVSESAGSSRKGGSASCEAFGVYEGPMGIRRDYVKVR